MTNPTFPWPMDKPVEEIEEFYTNGPIVGSEFGDYLLTRLKIAEGERKRTMTVKQAIEELEDRGLQEIIDLLKELEREDDYKTAKIARLQAEVDQLKYGGF